MGYSVVSIADRKRRRYDQNDGGVMFLLRSGPGWDDSRGKAAHVSRSARPELAGS